MLFGIDHEGLRRMHHQDTAIVAGLYEYELPSAENMYQNKTVIRDEEIGWSGQVRLLESSKIDSTTKRRVYHFGLALRVNKA